MESERIEQVMKAAEMAYAPYSNFQVGAVLETHDIGPFFIGCNVENASYSLGVCAERTAIVKAVSEGHRSFTRVYVHAMTEEFCWPCGACRQVLNEFGPDMEVISVNKDKKVCRVNLKDLLPKSFGPSDLKAENRK